jgi:hypothetical protein
MGVNAYENIRREKRFIYKSALSVSPDLDALVNGKKGLNIYLPKVLNNLLLVSRNGIGCKPFARDTFSYSVARGVSANRTH